MKKGTIRIRTNLPEKSIGELQLEAGYHRRQLSLINWEIQRQMQMYKKTKEKKC